MRIMIPGYRCDQCGHEWVPRSTERPGLCPKCKSLRWDKGPSLTAAGSWIEHRRIQVANHPKEAAQ